MQGGGCDKSDLPGRDPRVSRRGEVTTGHRQLQLCGQENDNSVYVFVSLQPASLQLNPSIHTCNTAQSIYNQRLIRPCLQSYSLPIHIHDPTHPSTHPDKPTPQPTYS